MVQPGGDGSAKEQGGEEEEGEREGRKEGKREGRREKERGKDPSTFYYPGPSSIPSLVCPSRSLL